MFRIGHGIDVHRLVVKQKPLMLAGIEIESPLALEAHSDGDVVLHALTDALLGAAGLGDIGRHYPDTDERYRGQNSAFFVHDTLDKITASGYTLGNIDITIMAQTPRLSPFIERMRHHLAKMLGIEAPAVNIKATTTEQLGFVGRKEGIEVHAVALIYKTGMK
ncbi:MAG: 2-C-methyl-D-erythritol 2,4-cyclodiphosphate synthase [Francisellaceae bacterium]